MADIIKGDEAKVYIDGEMVGVTQGFEFYEVEEHLRKAKQLGMSMSFSVYKDTKTDYLSPHLSKYFSRVTLW